MRILTRQGIGPAAAYEHARQQRQTDRDKLEQITRDSAHIPEHAPTGATAAGDKRKLRGVPVQARGVGGTSPGTDPLAEALANDRTTWQHLR